MKYQVPCSTRQGTSVPIWFLPESMPGHMHLYFSSQPLPLFLCWAFRSGLRQVLWEELSVLPLCCSTPGLPCSPGLPLDLQLSRDFAPGWHWCLTPPYLSITPLAPLPTCSPEMPAFSAWHGSHNCFWPTSSPVQLYLELLKTPNYVFTTNRSCRCPTSWLIRILCHLPRGQPPSMLIICFVILENVNKSVGLPIFFFFSYWRLVDI